VFARRAGCNDIGRPQPAIVRLAAEPAGVPASSVTQTSLHFASNLLKKYFNFDASLPDIVPDKMGKVAGVQWNAGEKTLEADCDEYLLGSDWYLKTITAGNDEDAKRPLLDHGLEIYASPKPSSYSVYFLPSPPSGEYDKKILDPVNNGLSPWKPPS
jgi:hypothetical protein